MASRKNRKLKLDEFGFDTGLDMPEFDFAGESVKDDRKPIVKFGKGALNAAKMQAVSPQFIRKLVLDALPKGFGEVSDFADQTSVSMRNLYNTAAKEVKPALTDLKRVTARVMPQVGNSLPKSVSDRIKKWSAPEAGGYRGMSASEQREATLGMQLGDVFKYQAETEARRDQEGFVKDKIKEGMEQSRHRDQLGQLNDIRQAVSTMAQYQTKIETNFQRKSLELQYRHYFLAMDQFEETKRHNAEALAEIKAVTKNTALPDYVKLQSTEAMTQLMRNRFMNSIHESVFSGRAGFTKGVMGRVGDRLMDKVKGITSGAREATDMANQVLDAKEMTAGMGGPGKAETAGGFAGEGAMWWLREKASKAGEKLAGKFKGIERFSNRAQQTLASLPQQAGEFARSGKGETGFSFLDNILNAVKDDILGQLRGQSTVLDTDGIGNLGEQALYSRHANKSITEIIPGFLARIYQELQIIRTGDSSIELASYDLSSNKFSTRSAAGKNLYKSIIGDAKQGVQTQTDELLNKLDPEGKLSASEREELGKRMLTDNLNNRAGDKKRMTDHRTWDGLNQDKIVGLFRNYYHGDEVGAKEKDFSKEFGGLGSGVMNSRSVIQQQVNAGLLDYLIESGLVDPATNSINMDRVLAGHLDRKDFEPGTGAQGGSVHSMAAARKARKSRPQPARIQEPEAPQQQYVRNDSKGWNDENKALFESIKVSGSEQVSYLKLTTEVLARIEERLNQGLTTYATEGEAPSAPAGSTGSGGPGWGQRIRARGRGWNMSVRDVIGKTAGGVGWAVGKTAAFGNSLVGSGFRLAGEAAGFGLKGARHVFDKARGIKDVFVPGERAARMKMWKLKAGHYRDAQTGKILKTFKDITGAVNDEEGNEVLSVEDAKKAFIKDGLVKKAFSGLTSITGAAFKLADGVASAVLGGFRPAAQLVGSVVKGSWGLLSRAQDVYVKGKTEPVLLARIMRTGGYFSKRTGRVIKHPGMIDGPVINEEQEVVLSEEELKGGVLDRNGNRIRTGLAKLVGMVAGGVSKGLGMAVGAASWVGGQIKGAFKTTADLLGKFALPDGILFSGGKKMLERLTEIRDLLTSRLPENKKVLGDIDGDGIRNGSFEDLMRKKKEADAATADKAGLGKDGDEKKPGFLAGLLGKMFGKKKEDEEDEDGYGLGDALEDASNADDLLDGDGRGKKRRGRKGRGRFGRLGRWGGKLGGWGKTGMKVVAGAGATALALRAAGMYAGDGVLGKMGVGKTPVDTVADNANWDQMSLMQKAESGVARGLENTAEYVLPMGNVINEAKAKRIAAESAYLGSKSNLSGANSVLTGPKKAGTVLPNAPAFAVANAGAAVGKAIVSTFQGWGRPSGGALDAMTALRYKTYGLNELVTEKTRALDALEAEAYKNVKFGSGGGASWSGNIDVLLTAMGPSFGVSGIANNNAYAWKSWFNVRFLPVYLNFLSALQSATGKQAPDEGMRALKNKDAVDVAVAVYTTSGAWSSNVSPWPGYTPSSDVSITEPNLQALKELAKKVVVEEVTGAADSKDAAGKDNGTGVTDGTANRNIFERSYDHIKKTAQAGIDMVKSAAGAAGAAVGAGVTAVTNGARAAGNAVAGAAGAVGGAVAGAGRAVSESAGRMVNAAGNAALVLRTGIESKMSLKELANFMGQMAHESANFTQLKEGLSYSTASRIKSTWPRNKELNRLSPDQVEGLVRNPEGLANVVYANRMGNTEPGDGYKYRGRGFTQLTGKYDYARCGKAIGVDLVNNPDLAADPAIAAKVALWYWKDRVQSKGAGEDVARAGLIINGGTNGAADRVKKAAEWEAKIKAGEGGVGGAGQLPTQTAANDPSALPEPLKSVPNTGGSLPVAGAPTSEGLIPVSSTTPAPTNAQASPPPSTPKSAMPIVGVDPLPTQGGGFAPTMAQSTRSQEAQAKVQSDESAKVLGSIDSTGKASLGIQTEQLEALRVIIGLMRGASKSAGIDPAPTEGSKAAPSQRAMPTPPVSMRKQA